MESQGCSEEYLENKYSVPKQFLNSLGFINYGHRGQLPWKKSDEEKGKISLPLPDQYTSVTEVLGIDCEMVGVGESKSSVLGRVSIVNEYGYCIYDTFAKHLEKVTDYRTEYSGIEAEDLVHAPDVETVLKTVAEIVDGKILIGHSIHFDLDVLRLNDHPKTLIRDTAAYFQVELGTKTKSSLKNLVLQYCNCIIQEGGHSSIEDAQAALKLYLMRRDKWENGKNVLLPLECGHFQGLTEKQMKNIKKVKCTTLIRKKLPCGHLKKVHCHQQIEFINCTTMCNKTLPCGHVKEIFCGSDLWQIKCSKCSQKQFTRRTKQKVCHENIQLPIKRLSLFDNSSSRQCKKIFKCGHVCRFYCLEKDNSKHLHYQCKERCKRFCPHGKPCPGDHQCYMNCTFKYGEKLVAFKCGHGSWIAKCCSHDIQKNCPKCS